MHLLTQLLPPSPSLPPDQPSHDSLTGGSSSAPAPWGAGEFSDLSPAVGWGVGGSEWGAEAPQKNSLAPTTVGGGFEDDDDFWGGGPEAQAVAIAQAQAAALAAAKKAGGAALEEDEWLVKGKDGKVRGGGR